MNKSILTNRKMKNFVMDTLAVLIVSCLCLLQPQIIDAYPDHWLHEEIEASVCAYHVPRRPKDLSSLSTYHEDIIDDALGTSVKAELDGEIVEALCPGQLHTFEFFFTRGGRSELRRAVVGVSQGEWAPSSGWVDVLPFCKQRADLGIENKPRSTPELPLRWRHGLSLACSASGEVVMEVSSSHKECTSACGGLSAIMVSTITLPIDQGCRAVACGPAPSVEAATPEQSVAPNVQDGTPSPTPEGLPGATTVPAVTAEGTARPPNPRPPPNPRRPPSPPDLPMAPSAPLAPSTAVVQGLLRPADSKCVSDLGYNCSAMVGPVSVHWTYDTKSAPENPCTAGYRNTSHGQQIYSQLPAEGPSGLVHFAIEAPTAGYVSLGFTGIRTKMGPADIIAGYAADDGSVYAETYYVPNIEMDDSHLTSRQGRKDWVMAKSAVQLAGPRTIVCFSRRILEPNAVVAEGQDLRITPGGSSTGRRSLFQQAAGPGADVDLIWTIHPQDRISQHLANNYGSGTMNFKSGDSTTYKVKDRSMAIRAHGILMTIAWVVLLPLGMLTPSHRFIFRSAKIAGKAAWFQVHLGLQMLGFVVFLVGFILGAVEFPDPIDKYTTAHKWIGVVVMILSGLQMVMAFVRPDPGHKLRAPWNLLHHNLGRIALILAWISVYLGVYAFHISVYKADMVGWLVPICLVMGFVVGLDVALRLAAPREDATVILSKDIPAIVPPRGATNDATMHMNMAAAKGSTSADDVIISAGSASTVMTDQRNSAGSNSISPLGNGSAHVASNGQPIRS